VPGLTALLCDECFVISFCDRINNIHDGNDMIDDQRDKIGNGKGGKATAGSLNGVRLIDTRRSDAMCC
jgi:hypothetical protein